jgi:hypothetical protein
MTQNFKKNPIINFVSPLDLWFSGKMLKSTKIALVVVLQIPPNLTGINLPTHQTPL